MHLILGSWDWQWMDGAPCTRTDGSCSDLFIPTNRGHCSTYGIPPASPLGGWSPGNIHLTIPCSANGVPLCNKP